jgi:hypothetical protein
MAKIVVSARLDVAYKASSSFVTSLFDHTFWMPDCGNVLTEGARVAPPSDCNSTCVGNSSQICGGTDSLNLNLYWSRSVLQPYPSLARNPNSWSLMGCYK